MFYIDMSMMNWNNIPNDVKRNIISYTGGFRLYHSTLFHNSLRSIEKRSSDYVCYICGLQNSFTRSGLTRNPSTRMYVKSNNETIEIFGKCLKHTDGPLSVDGVLIPRSVETDEQLCALIESTFPFFKTIFMFTSDENHRSGWKIISNKNLDKIDGSEHRTRSQSNDT